MVIVNLEGRREKKKVSRDAKPVTTDHTRGSKKKRTLPAT